MVDTIVDDRTLYEIYLPAFKAAVQEGGSYSIMGAYNKINGAHCCENKELLDHILREEWGFDGTVISDWGGVHKTKEAAEVSMDVEMSVFSDFENYQLANPLREAIEKGEISQSVLDDKVRNILRMMFRLKMIGRERSSRKAGTYNAPAHREAALQAAKESMILLKNEKNKLPLDAKKIKKLAVIGQNAAKIHSDGGGSAEIKALYEISPLMGIKTYLGGNVEVLYTPGYFIPDKPKTFDHNWQEKSLDELESTDIGKAVRQDRELMESDSYRSEAYRKEDEKEAAEREKDEKLIREKNEKLFAKAIALAKEADEVVFAGGLNHNYDSESFDRKDMRLPYEQDRLIEALLQIKPDMIITFIGGSPVEMPWRDKAQVILWSYYAGMETGNAFAGILFGEVNPSGKLAETFPVKYEDCATAGNGQFGIRGKIELKEGLYYGYRHFDRERIRPAFCFGHGLSYSQFAYGKMVLKKEKDGILKVTVSVKNISKREGMETVQLYVAPVAPKVDRPDKELKAFAKIKLGAGRSGKVAFSLCLEDFAHFDESRHGFVVDSGDYEILIGASCEDIRLKELYTLSAE